MLSTKVLKAEQVKDRIELVTSGVNDSKESRISCDVALVSVGRKPNTEGMGLAEMGIEVDQRGMINVNDYFQTNYSNIYAVGDVIRGPMLAHKAEEEAAIAEVEIMNGQGRTCEL